MNVDNSFSLWVKACEEFQTIIFCLEGNGNHGLYKMWNEYECRNNYYRTDPTYRVWIHGRDMYCGRSLNNAVTIWNQNKDRPFEEEENGPVSEN